ncbi:MAG TPA: hypothetical protein VF698_07070 [Thermoanaerobaculia bacterium]|jgi:hypothetical protein
MIRNRRERGEGQLGCVVGLVFLALAIMIAAKMIPVKVKTAELRDVVVDEARSAGTHDDGRIMKTILQKAEDLELPVTEDDVEIERRKESIRVVVTYTVPINFPGYTYNWNIEHKAENPIF